MTAIGIEMDENYFNIASKRIEAAKKGVEKLFTLENL